MPHGPIVELLPDLFMVTGRFRMKPGATITRNMAIVRHGGELTLVNSVRLDPQGEAALEALGTVRHLVRLGAMHGADDPYLVDRFGPVLWAPPGTRHRAGLQTDQELAPGSSPVPGSTVFLFEHGKLPEAALILDMAGGVLLSCDSYQNWTSFKDCSAAVRLTAPAMGFGPAVIGGPWARAMGSEIACDFETLVTLPFAHLLPAHGSFLRDTARADLRGAIHKRFGAAART